MGPRPRKHFYAVLKGASPSDTGIYDNWLSAGLVVDKVSGSIFQGFQTFNEAVKYLRQGGIPDPQVLPRDEDGVVHPMSIVEYLESDFNKDKLSVHSISPTKDKSKDNSVQDIQQNGNGSIILESQDMWYMTYWKRHSVLQNHSKVTRPVKITQTRS